MPDTSDTTRDTTLGPIVLLVRVSFDGDVERRWLPAALALDAASAWGEGNGTAWARAWIVADDVDMGAWDRSA